MSVKGMHCIGCGDYLTPGHTTYFCGQNGPFCGTDCLMLRLTCKAVVVEEKSEDDLAAAQSRITELERAVDEANAQYREASARLEVEQSRHESLKRSYERLEAIATQHHELTETLQAAAKKYDPSCKAGEEVEKVVVRALEKAQARIAELERQAHERGISARAVLDALNITGEYDPILLKFNFCELNGKYEAIADFDYTGLFIPEPEYFSLGKTCTVLMRALESLSK